MTTSPWIHSSSRPMAQLYRHPSSTVDVMDSVEVNQHSNAEDIEENRVFIDTLLESLDTGSEDYPRRYQELKSQRDYCDRLLSSKQRPSTPQWSRPSDPPSSSNLPSRPRLPPPQWGSSFVGPTDLGTTYGAFQKNTLSVPEAHDGYGSESSNGHLKRQRAESTLDPLYGNAKARRTTHITRPNTASTSESADSLDDLSILPSRPGLYEEYKKRQKEQEARWELEKKDKELARRLTQELQGMSDPPQSYHESTPFSFQPSTTSLDRHLPQVPYHQQQNTNIVPQRSHTSNVKSEFNSLKPDHSTRTRQTAFPGDQSYSAGTSDSDVELITPQQFQSAHRDPSVTHRPVHTPSRTTSQFGQPDMPGAFPQGAWSSRPPYPQNGYVNSGTYSQENSSGFHGYSAHSAGQDMTTMQRLQHFIGNLPGSAFTQPTGSSGPAPARYQSAYDQYHGQVGASVFEDDSDDGEPGPSGLTRHQLRDLHDRNMGYMLSDPSRTKEDIAQLLENIRPDEELPPEMREGGPAALSVPLMEHQKVGLAWLKRQEESSAKGSILADDMGLGKTIQAMALMLSRPSDDRSVKTTIIVAPVALLRQWQKEIQTKILPAHKLKVHIHHGQGPSKMKYHNLASFDVVLTTYGTLGAELKRLNQWENKKLEDPRYNASKPELNLLGENCRWYRVILDEAQAIKGRNTQAAQAACRLQAEHRLVMTGTPMMNNIEELYSLIRFLRIPPYNDLSKFTKTFGKLKKSVSERAKTRAMKCLQALLKAILLRRTKSSKIDGRPILNLKERFVDEDNAEFDEHQKAFYDSIETKSRLQFNKYLKAGTIGKNYSNILVMLLRLRQVCDHPHLIEDHGIPVGAEATESQMVDYAHDLGEGAVQRIKEADGAFECPICYDGSENPTIFFPCGHDVCADCFTQMMDPSLAMQRGEDPSTAKCPECRQTVDPQKVLTYNLFMKVHLPGKYMEKFPEEAEADNRANDDVDADSDSDFDTDSDTNSLDDFVVPDNEEVKEEEGSETEDETQEHWNDVKHEEASENESWPSKGKKMKVSSIKHKEESDDDFKPSKKKQSHAVNSNRHKSEGKGKGRAKAPKRTKTLAELKRESQRNKAAKRKYMKRLRKRFVSSTKIDKTLEILQDIRNNDATEKTIIFSQFTSFLDLLEIPIEDNGWSFTRYDGSMSAKERNEAVERFSEKPNCNIMLISLKAGNAGLNLNCASQVIILDPFWNPFIEEQAIDRAHRIGQMRDVHVHRVLIQGTVEDRIVALQEKKRTLINQALDEKAGQQLSRLGREELIFLFGSNDQDAGPGPAYGNSSDADDAEQLDDLMRPLGERPSWRARHGGA